MSALDRVLRQHLSLAPSTEAEELNEQAQAELLKLRTDIDELIREQVRRGVEIIRLRAIEAAAVFEHEALTVTMIAMSKEGIDVQRYIKLSIGELKDADEALAAALEPK
jgi:hypothetical protein